MTVQEQYTLAIPEDAWVERERRAGRAHKVFSSNRAVLTHCGRWLDRFSMERGFLTVSRHEPPKFRQCAQCVKAIAA